MEVWQDTVPSTAAEGGGRRSQRPVLRDIPPSQQNRVVDRNASKRKGLKESKLSEADPLTRWVEFFASPHGLEGENLEAKLAQVLEQLEPPADVHDKRLVTLWILYARASSSPFRILQKMKDRRIGQDDTIFYQVSAEFLMQSGEYAECDNVFMQGIKRQAQPLSDLIDSYAAFKQFLASKALPNTPHPVPQPHHHHHHLLLHHHPDPPRSRSPARRRIPQPAVVRPDNTIPGYIPETIADGAGNEISFEEYRMLCYSRRNRPKARSASQAVADEGDAKGVQEEFAQADTSVVLDASDEEGYSETRDDEKEAEEDDDDDVDESQDIVVIINNEDDVVVPDDVEESFDIAAGAQQASEKRQKKRRPMKTRFSMGSAPTTDLANFHGFLAGADVEADEDSSDGDSSGGDEAIFAEISETERVAAMPELTVHSNAALMDVMSMLGPQQTSDQQQLMSDSFAHFESSSLTRELDSAHPNAGQILPPQPSNDGVDRMTPVKFTVFEDDDDDDEEEDGMSAEQGPDHLAPAASSLVQRPEQGSMQHSVLQEQQPIRGSLKTLRQRHETTQELHAASQRLQVYEDDGEESLQDAEEIPLQVYVDEEEDAEGDGADDVHDVSLETLSQATREEELIFLQEQPYLRNGLGVGFGLDPILETSREGCNGTPLSQNGGEESRTSSPLHLQQVLSPEGLKSDEHSSTIFHQEIPGNRDGMLEEDPSDDGIREEEDRHAEEAKHGQFIADDESLADVLDQLDGVMRPLNQQQQLVLLQHLEIPRQLPRGDVIFFDFTSTRAPFSLDDLLDGGDIEIGNRYLHVEAPADDDPVHQLGQDSYTFEATDLEQDDPGMFTLSIDVGHRRLWDLYIGSLIAQRQKEMNLGAAFLLPKELYLYEDFGILLSDHPEHGTLRSLGEAYTDAGQTMHEILILYYAVEMLRSLETLHALGISHCALSADSFALRGMEGQDMVGGWTPSRGNGWQERGLAIGGFQHALDTNMFADAEYEPLPELLTLSGISSDSCKLLACMEWQYGWQLDAMAAASIIYQMLHPGVELVLVRRGALVQLSHRLQGFEHDQVWNSALHMLLNGTHELQEIRLHLEDAMIRDPALKQLGVLLCQQNIICYKNSQ